MPGYSVSRLSNSTITNLIIDSHTDEDVAPTIESQLKGADLLNGDPEKYIGSHSEFSFSTNLHGFDDAFIPETVWSLDVTSGSHLDHISETAAFEIYKIFGGRPEINDFWIKAIFGSWNDNNSIRVSGLLIIPLFQVASCRGSSAERSSLDYCSDVKLISDQLSDPSQKPEQSNSDTTIQGDNHNNVVSSRNRSASAAGLRPIIAPSAPAIDYKSMLQGTFLGACDVSTSCASVPIDAVETPVDPLDPLRFIGDLTPPIDLPNPEAPPSGPIIQVDDPGPGSKLPPVFIPQPLKAIPEASTWVMTIIGFSNVAFFFGRKRHPRINPISIVDISEV